MDDQIFSISKEDVLYPESLKEISDAPKVLYYRGVLPTANEIIFAIVGTRHPSPYGQQVAMDISGQLTDAGVTIVSGLAPGIDTFAHKAVVEKGKRTIAVLGTGLDEKSLYPKSNLELSRKILEHGGCLISELPEGTSATVYSFPRRNRIVSALSQGVLVVEAKEKSGSLITADFARKHKKKLFAIPGSIYTANAAGPNTLIQNGATLVKNVKDILDTLGVRQAAATAVAAENPQESLILSALSEGSLTADAIIKKTNLQAFEVSSQLALMEISGKIRNLGGNQYSIH